MAKQTPRQALADAVEYLQRQHELNAAQRLSLWAEKNFPPSIANRPGAHKWGPRGWPRPDERDCIHCGLQFRWAPIVDGEQPVGHWVTRDGDRIKKSGNPTPKCHTEDNQ